MFAAAHVSDHGIKMAEQVARVAGTTFACLGFFDCAEARLVDHKIAPAQVEGRISAQEAVQEVERHVRTQLAMTAADPALKPVPVSEVPKDDVIWIKSSRHLIGIGERAGSLVPVAGLICDAPAQFDLSARRDLVRLGLTYTAQQMHHGAAARPEPEQQVAGAILNSLSINFAVVDAARRVHFMTRESARHLAQSEVLALRQRHLGAAGPRNQRLLQDAIQAAIGNDVRSCIVQLEDAAGVPQTLVALPIRNLPGRALVVFGREEDDEPMQNLLLMTFGLTDAERRLALQMLKGKTLAEAAEAANLTISTARSYLKRIFAKTGIHRQSELIALYHKLIPPVRTMQGQPPTARTRYTASTETTAT